MSPPDAPGTEFWQPHDDRARPVHITCSNCGERMPGRTEGHINPHWQTETTVERGHWTCEGKFTHPDALEDFRE